MTTHEPRGGGEPDWAAIRLRYETTQDPVAAICRDAGIDQKELGRVRRREAWRRQNPRPFPAGRSKAPPEPPPTQGPATGDDTDDGIHVGSLPSPVPETPEPSPPEPEPQTPRRLRSLPATTAGRKKLLDRLVNAISLKLEQLERQMSKSLDADVETDPTTATDHERETRAIGALIDNLEKITELETANRSARGRQGSAISSAPDLAREAERCRQELADRLARIVEAAAGET